MRARAAAERQLRASNVSANTIATYGSAVELLADFLERHELPTDVMDLRREHIEGFVAELLDRWKPATANNRFRGCQRFFNWLVEEEVLAASPMARMQSPRIPEQPVEVLRRTPPLAARARAARGTRADPRHSTRDSGRLALVPLPRRSRKRRCPPPGERRRAVLPPERPNEVRAVREPHGCADLRH
jgi:hypothetical protein